MTVIMANQSFRDSGLAMNHPQFGAQVLASIAGVLDEYVNVNLTARSLIAFKVPGAIQERRGDVPAPRHPGYKSSPLV